MVSRSLRKGFERVACQTYAGNFHKTVKDTSVVWCAWTSFPKVSQWCWKWFKTEILDGRFSRQTSEDFSSSQVISLVGLLAEAFILLETLFLSEWQKVIDQIIIKVIKDREVTLYKYYSSQILPRKKTSSVIAELLWSCTLPIWHARVIRLHEPDSIFLYHQQDSTVFQFATKEKYIFH